MLRFDAFVLDFERHVLTRAGRDVALSPDLVEILEYLASRPGEVVTERALLDRFGGAGTITDNTLRRAMAEIRKALGDDVTAPRFIETLARGGYRFVAATMRDATAPLRDVVHGRAALESLDATRLPGALATFEQAVAATPEDAPAHTGLASAYLLQYEATRASNTPERDSLVRALTHARHACALDPELGEAWATLGFVLAAAGEAEEARAVARRAAALDPTSWRHQFRLAVAAWGEERLRACDRTLGLVPEFAPARFAAAMVFIARQAFGSALAAASAGAAAQTRQLADAAPPFPAIGLHWLRGLLLLRERQIGLAIEAFAREIDELREAQIYAGEFRVNAQVAAGFAHLAAQDASGAIDVFRMSLETLPRNGRALVGLYSALQKTSFATESHVLIVELEGTIAELVASKRSNEAALIRAAVLAAQGDLDAGCAALEQLLGTAPPGHFGWQIPVDPALAPLRAHARFPGILARLAARAA